MRPSEGHSHPPVLPGANSPYIFDPELAAPFQESDLEFFDTTGGHTSPPVSSRLFDDFLVSSPVNPRLAEDDSKSSGQGQWTLGSSEVLQKHTGSLLGLSGGSTRGSPSGRPVKQEVILGQEQAMDWSATNHFQSEEDGLYGLGETALPQVDGMSDPISAEDLLTASNQTMSNDFDFDSAGSSPTPFGLAMPSNMSVRSSNPSTTMRLRSPAHLDSPVTQPKSASPVSASIFFGLDVNVDLI